MNDTPETDAAVVSINLVEFLDPDVARKLERERNTLKARVAELEASAKQERLAGLCHALYLCRCRRGTLRHVAWNAALDDLTVFLRAAIERVEAGQDMADSAQVQCTGKEAGRHRACAPAEVWPNALGQQPHDETHKIP